MAKKKNQSYEELLEEALVPEEEQPYDVPENWKWLRFGRAVTVNPPKHKPDIPDDQECYFVPMAAVSAETGTISEPETRPYSKVKSGFTSFLEGDVIFAKITPCMENGKSAVAENLLNGFGFGSTEFHVFRVNSNVHRKYIYYLVRSGSFREDARKNMSGSVGQQRVPKDYLLNYPLALPPVQEQERIVSRVESLLSKISDARELIQEARVSFGERRSAILAKAFRGELTAGWRERNPDVEGADTLLEKIKQKRLDWIDEQISEGKTEAKRLLKKLEKQEYEIPSEYELPSGWRWASFLEYCQTVVDCHNKTAPYIDDGIYLVRTSNIRDGKFNFDGVKYISQETYDYWARRCPPEPGDVIFTREAPMGEAAIIPDNTKLCMGQRMMLLRMFTDLSINKYLLYATLEASFQHRMGTSAVGTGVKHLRVRDVESLLIPVAPLEEQKEIVRIVENMLKIEDEASDLLEMEDQLDLLEKSILSKAFRGELGTNDPDESPVDMKELLGVKEAVTV